MMQLEWLSVQPKSLLLINNFMNLFLLKRFKHIRKVLKTYLKIASFNPCSSQKENKHY